MRGTLKLGLLLFIASFLLSGCVVRTYKSTRDRVDQDLSAGNRGFLLGKSVSESVERKPTRSTQVVEVELRPLFKFENKGAKNESMGLEDQDISGNRGMLVSEGQEQSTGRMEQYTVQKNDTLQKISGKFFGTTKKWTKIYDANKDTMKGPNKLRPGQVINIPVEGMKETKDNLK